MSPRWQSLPTRNESAPPLLYSFDYTPQFYEFHLTDLTYIWFEHLDHKHILRRAEDSETSIDPSEDANQYAVFMQKIQDALRGAKSSIVNVAANGKPGSLSVTTSTNLPGGLRPLKWSFSLSRERPSAVTRQLLLPLLKGEKEHEKREQSLLDHIRDKDSVLSKIFDKIDASQLTTMFPGTTGARHAKPKISDLIKHIKGATKFDEKEWRGNLKFEHTVVSDVENFAESVSKFTGSAISDTWWENLDNGGLASKSSSRLQDVETRRKSYSSTVDTDAEGQKDLDEDKSTEDEDEFQRQETPPHLKRKKEETFKKQVHKNAPDGVAGTTESDQENESTDELESRRAPVHKVKPPPKNAVGRIGGPKAVTLGRSRKESASLSTDSDSTSESPKSKQRTTGATRKMPELNDDSSISSDSELGPSAASRSKSPGPKKDKHAGTTITITTKPKGALGRIGGRKPEPKKPLQPPSPEALDDVVETQSSSEDDERRHRPPKPLPTPKRTKKLGLIGGGKKKTQPNITLSPKHESDGDDLDAGSIRKATKAKLPSSPSPPPPPSKSPSPIQQRRAPKPEREPEPELSAEQKANRKREELKRQLDARSKAPVKKKRKF
ncbi:hypothetical protein UA08_08349 [Talaromyces atroroseus]|uniref:Non-homologous end-joining factor 1 n=1 Tax=Talaromyces atroroseus TaxID=1441469 RepID=A0A225AT56_TALAT|nr:hypothetical protein UA08_08349 [Talaromyces atroroseus]OKL56647.1 hypothetical protein UA08_08349 [Talaromyces atroroseus]